MASCPQIDEHRREPRVPAHCRATARVALSVEVLNASRNGLQARISIPLPIGTALRMRLPGGLERHARIAWVRGEVFGCEFVAPLAPRELDAVVAATPIAVATA